MPTRVRVIEVETDTEGETTALAAALRILQSGTGGPPLVGGASAPMPPVPAGLPSRDVPSLPDASTQVALGESDAPLLGAPLLGPPAPLPAAVDVAQASEPAKAVVGGASAPMPPVPARLPSRKPKRRAPAAPPAGKGAGAPSKKFACPSCAFSSGTPSGLSRHRNQQHGVSVAKADARREAPARQVQVGGSHPCSICNKPFSKSSDLARHMAMKHGRPKSLVRPPAVSTLAPDPSRSLADADDADESEV